MKFGKIILEYCQKKIRRSPFEYSEGIPEWSPKEISERIMKSSLKKITQRILGEIPVEYQDRSKMEPGYFSQKQPPNKSMNKSREEYVAERIP